MSAEKVLELGNGLELWKVPPSEVREQDVNARSMTPKMFERLEKTIQRDGRLESLPFCATADRGLEVVSGHHRVRAATAAQVPLIYVVVDVSGLTRSQIAAKQLAHNSIQGEDNDQLVQEIYRQIEDAELRLESFIADIPAEKIDVDSLEVPIEFKSVLLTFLPNVLERVEDAIEYLQSLPQTDKAWIATVKDREKMEAAIKAISNEYDIRVVADAIGKMAEIALESCGKPVAISEAVHLKDLFGSAWVSKDAAETIRAAVKMMMDAGVIGSKIQAIEAWAKGTLNAREKATAS